MKGGEMIKRHEENLGGAVGAKPGGSVKNKSNNQWRAKMKETSKMKKRRKIEAKIFSEKRRENRSIWVAGEWCV